MNSAIKIFALLTLGFFSILMINITIPYFSMEHDVAFLRIKQWVITNDVWRSSFYVHVFASCFSLMAGFTQFSESILRKQRAIHRSMGYVYVVVILLLSGPSGVVMSLYANGGLLSQSAFLSLSILWMLFTYLAFSYAKKRDYQLHREFMIRSFALTLSALTLRTWKYLIVMAFRPQPMDAYMLVAWLGWVPNLIFAEGYIRTKLRMKIYNKSI